MHLSWALGQGQLFWLFEAGFKVSSGTVKWYRSSYGTDFENSEIASPVGRLHFVMTWARPSATPG